MPRWKPYEKKPPQTEAQALPQWSQRKKTGFKNIWTGIDLINSRGGTTDRNHPPNSVFCISRCEGSRRDAPIPLARFVGWWQCQTPPIFSFVLWDRQKLFQSFNYINLPKKPEEWKMEEFVNAKLSLFRKSFQVWHQKSPLNTFVSFHIH